MAVHFTHRVSREANLGRFWDQQSTQISHTATASPGQAFEEESRRRWSMALAAEWPGQDRLALTYGREIVDFLASIRKAIRENNPNLACSIQARMSTYMRSKLPFLYSSAVSKDASS